MRYTKWGIFLFFSLFSFLELQGQGLSKLGIDTLYAIPNGLQVGERAPDFQGTDQFGNALSLAEMLKEGPVVLIFYRGDWCQVCNRYLGRFQDSLQLITGKGAQVLAVTPETNENIQQTVEKTKAGFRVLSDRNEEIMEAYGVKFKVTDGYRDRIRSGFGDDIAENNGQDEANLPVPATYIIDAGGEIVFRQFDLDYRVRASIADILSHLPGQKTPDK